MAKKKSASKKPAKRTPKASQADAVSPDFHVAPTGGSWRRATPETAARAAMSAGSWDLAYGRALDVLKAQREALMKRYPCLVGIDVGPKKTAGRHAMLPAIRLFVRQKLDPREVAPKDMLPQEIDGVPVDVIAGEFSLATAATISGGDWMAPAADQQNKGTMAVAVRDPSQSNFPLLLTCAHVVDRNKALDPNPIDMIHSGGPVGKSLTNPPMPGNALNWSFDPRVDAALVEPNAGQPVRKSVISPEGQRPTSFGVATDSMAGRPDAIVWKLGLSGYSTGVIESVRHSAILSDGTPVLEHIMVQGNHGAPFAKPGDSGAAIVFQNQVVGLVRATSADGRALCCHIRAVANRLNVDMFV